MVAMIEGRFRIVGVVLLRNEDLYIRSAIRNVLPCCDELIVFDHQSIDESEKILQEIVANDSRVTVRKIRSPEESHTEIEKYAGTNSWVFAVDGDEIYDPARTFEFTNELREGRYSEWFQIRGNVLHVNDWDGDRYQGYLGPPSRAMNKLYNFSHLESWRGGFERLHGGEKIFREGFSEDRRLVLSDTYGFDDSPFRCLHLVFLRRSSREKNNAGYRLNIADQVGARFKERVIRRIKGWIGKPVVSEGKMKNYRLGECVSISDATFALAKEQLIENTE